MQPLDGGVAVRGFVDFVPGFGQAADQPPPQRVVIVSDENSTHVRLLLAHSTCSIYLNQPEALDTGSVTRNRVPVPCMLLTSMRPSCASTIFRTIAQTEPGALRLGREERIEDPVA